jgi:cytoskeletal protein CcmA (bactofilin family)
MFDKWRSSASGKKTTATGYATPYGSVPNSAHLKPSIISEGVAIEGDFLADHGILHLDGSIHGNVRITALTIGPTGHLDGSVDASSVTVRGVLVGRVTCDDLVLDASARVSGTIRYRRLAISGGAVIDGSLVRLPDSPADDSPLYATASHNSARTAAR